MHCSTSRSTPAGPTPRSARPSSAITCSMISQPASHAKQRRFPFTPPTWGSSQVRSFIRWIERAKLVAETSVITAPTTPNSDRTWSGLNAARTDCVSSGPSPVAPWKRWLKAMATSCGRNAAITMRSGTRASSPCAAITIERSMTSTRTSSVTNRCRPGTMSSIRRASSRNRCSR